jgi:hypothetical protein
VAESNNADRLGHSSIGVSPWRRSCPGAENANIGAVAETGIAIAEYDRKDCTGRFVERRRGEDVVDGGVLRSDAVRLTVMR